MEVGSGFGRRRLENLQEYRVTSSVTTHSSRSWTCRSRPVQTGPGGESNKGIVKKEVEKVVTYVSETDIKVNKRHRRS